MYMLCYLILNGIYRNYLMADGYETERHFFEGLTAFCRIQVTIQGSWSASFLYTLCSDARVFKTCPISHYTT